MKLSDSNERDQASCLNWNKGQLEESGRKAISAQNAAGSIIAGKTVRARTFAKKARMWGLSWGQVERNVKK